MAACECQREAATLSAQRVLLLWLLAINLSLFVVEGAAGWVAQSSGLLADSLDMLADAAVYAIAYWAVGRTLVAKQRAAAVSGLGQLLLALLVLGDTGRRLLVGSDPESSLIIGVACLALLANGVCMALLRRHRDGEIHLRASWLFSTSDVLANLAVIAGGVLVAASGSPWPDLVIGSLIALWIARTGVKILIETQSALRPS